MENPADTVYYMIHTTGTRHCQRPRFPRHTIDIHFTLPKPSALLSCFYDTCAYPCGTSLIENSTSHQDNYHVSNNDSLEDFPLGEALG